MGVSDAFLLEDSCSEGVGGIIIFDGAGSLDDDRSFVVFVSTEVDGAAGDFASCIEDGLVDVVSPHTCAAEAWQQCRVYVHDFIFVSFWDFPEAEPAALDDEVDFCSDKFFFDSCAEPFDVGVVFFSNDFDIESCVFGSFDAGYGGA